MVIPDPQQSAKPTTAIQLTHSPSLTAMTRPQDRLGAAIVDIFVVLMPAYLLLSAPLKLELTTSFLLGSDTGIFIYIVAQIFLSFGMITLYQAYMHSRWGATVGKLIFGLRVRTIFGNTNPSFGTSFKRAFVWFLEILALGIPWLGVFTDNQRRVLHDRICDTEVIGLKDFGVRPPYGLERGLVQGFFGMFILLFSLSLIGSMVEGMRRVGQDRSLASLLMQDDRSCAQVNEAMDSASRDESETAPTRLQMAMSLYAAGSIEKECLAFEAEQDLDVKLNSSPLAYLAKAFVHSEEADISDAYLEQVCQDGPGSPECSMSQLVSSWSDEDWKGVEEVIQNAKEGSVYLEIWAIRHYLKQGEYAKALEYISKISPNRAIAGFLQLHRVKALWNMHREPEAVTATAQALESMQPAEQLELSAWVCNEQLIHDCSASTFASCNFVRKHTVSDQLDPSDAVIGLAQLRVKECGKEASVDYIGLADNTEDDTWKIFLRASAKKEKSDRDSAAALFSQVIKHEDAPDELRLEALRRFLVLAKSNDVLDLLGSWRDMKSGELWRKSGNLLLSTLIRREEKLAALKVARSLLNQQALADETMQSLAAMIQLKVEAVPGEERNPASLGLPEKIKELLEAEPDESSEESP